MDFIDFKNVLPLTIPLVALLIPIIAIVGNYMTRSRHDQLLHETVRQLSERGQPIPPELLNSDLCEAPKRSSLGRGRSPLSDGLVGIAIGLGLMVMFWAMRPGDWLWAIGCIPLFVGIAKLLVWRFEAKQDRP